MGGGKDNVDVLADTSRSCALARPTGRPPRPHLQVCTCLYSPGARSKAAPRAERRGAVHGRAAGRERATGPDGVRTDSLGRHRPPVYFRGSRKFLAHGPRYFVTAATASQIESSVATRRRRRRAAATPSRASQRPGQRREESWFSRRPAFRASFAVRPRGASIAPRCASRYYATPSRR